ncbi:hypothetical protein Pla163_01080 [Planctomycetes bacterium Pla163]|uniref:Uncharacterized protein n=1 Tax=Rohdeia mirabilis TaxID=2528008 RepID=A0A518CUW8_9BACT|nr:hypothetical protein Pla163_01080 [Planctomycetes bacterium Pla163]
MSASNSDRISGHGGSGPDRSARTLTGAEPAGVPGTRGRATWRRAIRDLGLGCLVALATTACSPGGTQIAPQHLAAAQDALTSVAGLPDVVAHTGLRRIRSTRDLLNDRVSVTEFRELVQVAHTGDFSLECTEVISSPLADPTAFMLRQNAREGFMHRYRDFRIHDAGLLLENYVVLQFVQNHQVAGRDCFVVQLERRDDPRRTEPIIGWVIAVDYQSGLILQWERTANGEVTDEGVYESIALGPPRTLVPHVPGNAEEIITPHSNLDALFDFRPTTPILLPRGFERIERARVVDGRGRPWLKETFTDGIEVAFFLYREEPADPLTVALGGKLGHAATGNRSQIGSAASSVAGSSLGAATAAPTTPPTAELIWAENGDVGLSQLTDGRRTGIVAGRVGRDDRQLMLEAALF